jgi:Zn finger protein HypA/HybF involved in hydrogenase expression
MKLLIIKINITSIFCKKGDYMNNSVEFYCKCGRHGWISEDEETIPCPDCGRRYVGVYNKKKLTIIAKQLKGENHGN